MKASNVAALDEKAPRRAFGALAPFCLVLPRHLVASVTPAAPTGVPTKAADRPSLENCAPRPGVPVGLGQGDLDLGHAGLALVFCNFARDH